MRRYQIHVGRIGGKAAPLKRALHEDVVNASALLLPGFTAYDAAGCWQGHVEPTTVVEFVAFGPEDDKAARLAAESLRLAFGQDSVLLVSEPVAAEFIGIVN